MCDCQCAAPSSLENGTGLTLMDSQFVQHKLQPPTSLQTDHVDNSNWKCIMNSSPSWSKKQQTEQSSAHLHRVEVQVCLVAAGGHAAGGAATHANAVGWAADLDHQHAHLAISLLQVPVVDLAHTAGDMKTAQQTWRWLNVTIVIGVLLLTVQTDYPGAAGRDCIWLRF